MVFQRHVGTATAAAATAAAATELSRVSPGIFPFDWSVFRRLEPRESLPGGQYRKNGPSHHPILQSVEHGRISVDYRISSPLVSALVVLFRLRKHLVYIKIGQGYR